MTRYSSCGYQGRPDNAGPHGILAPWLTKTPEIEPSTRRSRRWTKSPLPCRPTSSKNTRQIPSGPPRRARPPILSSFYGRPGNVSAKDYEPSRRTRSPRLTRSRSAGNDPNRAQPRQRGERATRQQHDDHAEAIAAHQADTENCSDSGDEIFLHLRVSLSRHHERLPAISTALMRTTRGDRMSGPAGIVVASLRGGDSVAAWRHG